MKVGQNKEKEKCESKFIVFSFLDKKDKRKTISSYLTLSAVKLWKDTQVIHIYGFLFGSISSEN